MRCAWYKNAYRNWTIFLCKLWIKNKLLYKKQFIFYLYDKIDFYCFQHVSLVTFILVINPLISNWDWKWKVGPWKRTVKLKGFNVDIIWNFQDALEGIANTIRQTGFLSIQILSVDWDEWMPMPREETRTRGILSMMDLFHIQASW